MPESASFAILIVDDNANNRFVLRTLLSRLKDCLIIEASSGQEALRCTFEQKIHLILLDVQMPEMDGYETARHLAMIKRTRDIPIVFITAVFKSEEFMRRGYAIGAVDYLTKPIDDNLLLNRIDSYRKLRERECRLADALEQIQLREERLSYALEATQDGIWDWNLVLDTLLLSQRCESMLGYPSGTLPSRFSAWIENYTHPDDLERLKTTLGALERNEKDLIALEYRARSYSGSWAWILLRAKVVQKGSDGRVRRVVGANADISQRIVAEQATQKAKLAAEAANRAKNIFLANISHELRTPLNAILGFSQILERDSRLADDQRLNIITIGKSGRRLLALINNVLEISRIESGNLTAIFVPCDLHKLLNTLVEVMSNQATDSKLSFYYKPSSELPRYILTDANKLRQILIQLLSNAIKYTQHGQITFKAYGRIEANLAHLTFEVADNGIGITMQDLERIFRPFFQTEDGMKYGEGTGLGLAISREYANLLGGTLTVESSPKHGSVFYLRIPSKILVTSDSLSPALAADMRILIAEQLNTAIAPLSDFLAQSGYAVKNVTLGQQAVEQFQSWHPHLIFIDLYLPDMNCCDATQAIRALPGGQDVPIVALTIAPIESSAPELFAAGCNNILQKPVEAGQLLEIIQRHLQNELTQLEESLNIELNAKNHPVSLENIPSQLCITLRNAAERLDIEAIAQVINQIKPLDNIVATHLESMANDFQIEQIITLCR